MFEALERAVEELEVPADPAALTQVWALVDRLTAKATMAAAAFDEHELWDVDGDTSLTGWLRHRAGMTSRDAAASHGAPCACGAPLPPPRRGSPVA